MNQITKKFIFTIIFGVLETIVLVTPVLAATTLLFAPANIDVAEGEDFTMRVVANPERGIKSYTIKLELEYPADLLEVKSFTIADNWMQLNQSGYDLIDNTNGLLIKTAGFPGGFSGPITFGTASFLAKKEGEGIIKVGEDSFVLDSASQDVLGGFLDETLVKIAALPPEEEIIPEEEATPALFDILIAPVARQVQKKPYLPIIIVILILIIVGYVLYRKRRKKRV